MNTLDEYHRTHAEVRQLIAALSALLATAPLHVRDHAETAYALLCDLDERLRDHLAAADYGLYPRLLIHEDPQVTSLAWALITEEKPLRETCYTFHARWLKHCDFHFNDDFVSETRQVCALVTQRLDQEERLLIPKLIELGLVRMPPRAGKVLTAGWGGSGPARTYG